MVRLRFAISASVLAIILSGCFTASLIPDDENGVDYPSPWSQTLTPVEFQREAVNDLINVKQSEKGLKEINRWLHINRSRFLIDSAKGISPDVKKELLPVWISFLDHFYRLEALRIKHSSYWKINGLINPVHQALSFSVFNSSFLVQNTEGSSFIDAVADNKRLELWLEEPNALFPQFAYSRLKYRVLNFLTFDDIAAHRSYFRESILPIIDTMSDTVVYWSERRQNALPDTLLAWASSRNVKRTGLNGVDIAGKQLFSFFFPVQKGLADFLGKTYYNPLKKRKFITEDQADSLERMLRPGDLILVRSNYVASNIGLPGFWPHIAIYTGKQKELKELFKDDESAIPAILKDTANKECNVIEALANGTVFREFRKTANADYLGVLRPKISNNDRKAALLKAFSYVGVPYDWDFDFDTDVTLVCSEVVYKSYEARCGMEQGLSIPLELILGRWTLPPNNIAALYASETDMQQFEFVAFLDHEPKTDSAFFSTDSSFKKSHARSKWDFVVN
ncbi:MAG: hypothetical protein JNL74_17040 [Fibrobacteres bacterium]|nr:hypothetical protein [Fibrobacterota bacterium]